MSISWSVVNFRSAASTATSLPLSPIPTVFLLIDGIDEGDRSAWKKSLPALAHRLGEYANIGLVLSCRRPFEKQIVTTAASKLFVEAEHLGFEENEFDAQVKFFDYLRNSHAACAADHTGVLPASLPEAVLRCNQRLEHRAQEQASSGYRLGSAWHVTRAGTLREDDRETDRGRFQLAPISVLEDSEGRQDFVR